MASKNHKIVRMSNGKGGGKKTHDKDLNLFPLFRVEQKVTGVKHNLMKLFVPSRECRHLHVR